jgi:hypothetical protein
LSAELSTGYQQRLSLLLLGLQSLRTILTIMKLINVIKATFAT